MTFEEMRGQAVLEWEALKYGKVPIIRVGAASCGVAAGAEAVLAAIESELARRGIEAVVSRVGCIGLCYAEPIVDVTMPGQPGVSYGNVTAEMVPRIVWDHVINGDPCLDLALGMIRGNGHPAGAPELFDIPMLRPQSRVVLRNCGITDPENMQHYLANFGYSGFARALTLMPEEVVDEVARARLRGREGLGFPTAEKLEACRAAPGEKKYVICNADEGDPGSFVNRTLLESDPHSVVEGMLIGAYAVGASEGYIYCRSDQALAVQRLRVAVQQMEERGLLGRDIFGSGFGFDVRVVEGAGGLVCLDDTALIARLEGRRAMPKGYPPGPAVSGLWGRPTVVNNAETWTNVAVILQRGSGWFRRYGTEASKGTKVFSLAGKVNRIGPIEVRLGTILSEVVYGIGGGIANGKRFKAVHVGGPLGGCLPSDFLNTPIDYEAMAAAGAMLGSSIIVLDEETCTLDLARNLLAFTQSESCGKCVPCRVGTTHMLRVLEGITRGQGKPDDIGQLQKLAQTVRDGSLCPLGQNAPNPVLTTMLYFRDEYEAHINEKRCPAGVCLMGVSGGPAPARVR